MKKHLAKLWQSSNLRSAKAKKNILLSLFLKVINSVISLLIVPLYLSYLTDVAFGLWLTISSVINWFNLFDFGLGNGLRNRLAEAKAAGDEILSAKYVSTSYAILGLFSAGLLILLIPLHNILDWAALFSAPDALHGQVNQLVPIMFALFFLQFVVQLIKTVATADQRPALANLLNTIVNIGTIAFVFFLTKYAEPSLLVLGTGIAVINLTVPLIASVVLFATRYRSIRPRISNIDWKISKGILSLGFGFFILQGAALVVFMTDNFIITKVLGPAEVPSYNVAYRYFGFATVLFSMLTAPFWTAITDAYVQADYQWIRGIMRKLQRAWMVLLVAATLMLLLAPQVYHLWIGDQLDMPFSLNLCMFLWVILSSYASIYGTFLSGAGTIRLSIYHSVFVMVVNIPLSILLVNHTSLGAAGVILATTLGLLPRLVFQPIQYRRLISGAARGIWAR